MKSNTTSNAPSLTKPKVFDRRIPPMLMDNRIRRLFFPPEKVVSKYVSPGEIVADLGCGPGYFALPIARIVGQKGKVYAVDFNAKSIERLTAKATKLGFEKTIEARIGSASNVSFIPDASIDFVFANGLLCCMTDHLGAVCEINRILKKEPKGFAYLSVTKFARKGDPRAVSKDEWTRLVSKNFNIIKHGENFTSRWAKVSPLAASTTESHKKILTEEQLKGMHNASCCCT